MKEKQFRKWRWWMTPLAILLSPLVLVGFFIAAILVMVVLFPTALAITIICLILKIEPPKWVKALDLI